MIGLNSCGIFCRGIDQLWPYNKIMIRCFSEGIHPHPPPFSESNISKQTLFGSAFVVVRRVSFSFNIMERFLARNRQWNLVKLPQDTEVGASVKIDLFYYHIKRPNKVDYIITGAQPKAGTGHKMQTVSVVFSTLHC